MSYRPTPSETASYHRDGYLVVPHPILPPGKFAELVDYTERIYETYTQPERKPPALIDCPHWRDPKMFDWLMCDEMIALVEPLIGPDIGIFASHFLRKPAAVGHGVPWHEDSMYWATMLKPLEVASVTIALTPATPENGCLRVVAGSHLNKAEAGYSQYQDVQDPERQVFRAQIVPEQVDESRAIDIVLEPNQASIHDGRIIHGSALNTGTIGRCCLTVRYFPTHVHFYPEGCRGEFHVFQARGHDHADNRFSDPNDNSRIAAPKIATA